VSLAILLAAGLSTRAVGSSTPVQVFLLAGQSNMEGRLADGTQLPPDLQQPQADVLYRDGGPLDPQPWANLAPKDWTIPAYLDPSTGPEVSFGRTVADGMPDREVAVIKYAVGGTPITSWDPAYPLSLYSELISLVTSATAELQDDGMITELAGFIWVQGESDAYDVEEDALAYEARLTALIHAVRGDLAKPNLPVVIARVYPAASYQYADEVRAAQAAVNNGVPYTALVDADDLTLTDEFHYDANGQNTLGQRLADAYLFNLRGDIDGDGFTMPADADALLANLGGADPHYDLNDDGVVDLDDINYLVHSIAGTRYGDLDFDGSVILSEAQTVVDNIGLPGASFSDGDQNGDDAVSFREAAIAASNIDAPAPAQLLVIPEPGAAAVLVLVLLIGRRK
jgi:hypothetical protein